MRAIHSGRARATVSASASSRVRGAPAAGGSTSAPGTAPPGAFTVDARETRRASCSATREAVARRWAGGDPRERSRRARSAPSARTSSESRAVKRAARAAPTTGEAARSARPSGGSRGREARARPKGVAAPASSMAPNARSLAPAAFHAPAGGASSRASPVASGAPHTAACKRAPVRSWTAMPGADWAGRREKSTGSMTRTAMPGPRRAARPARCSRRAREAGTVASWEIPRAASRRGSRAREASTTTRTPGTVSDDSARDVESTMRRREPGDRAASCWAALRRPWRGSTSAPGALMRERTRSISATPGRNTSRSPSLPA